MAGSAVTFALIPPDTTPTDTTAASTSQGVPTKTTPAEGPENTTTASHGLSEEPRTSEVPIKLASRPVKTEGNRLVLVEGRMHTKPLKEHAHISDHGQVSSHVESTGGDIVEELEAQLSELVLEG